jgi:hypothetical protein
MLSGSLKTEIKSGNEAFTYQSNRLDQTLIDFWKWNCSDLVSNALRGRLAEFIVALATDVDVTQPREEWAAYDLLVGDIRVEIKSAAYIQSWHQQKPSSISFSVRPSRFWNAETATYSIEATFQADVYVFCLLHHQDKNTIQPLDLSQWEFYVLPASEVMSLTSITKRIPLKRLQENSKVSFAELKEAIRSSFSPPTAQTS